MSLVDAFRRALEKCTWEDIGPTYYYCQTEEGCVEFQCWDSIHGLLLIFVNVMIAEPHRRTGIFTRMFEIATACVVDGKPPVAIQIGSVSTVEMASFVLKHGLKCSEYDISQAYHVCGEFKEPLPLVDLPRDYNQHKWFIGKAIAKEK